MTRHVPFASSRPAILICQRDPLTGGAMARAIRNCGIATIGPVSSASDALDAADRSACDIAIIDIRLDDGRLGPALARRLHARGIQVIICSREATTPGELADIPHVFLARPVPPDLLQELVLSALRRRHAAERSGAGTLRSIARFEIGANRPVAG